MSYKHCVGNKKNKVWIWTRPRIRPVLCEAQSNALASRKSLETRNIIMERRHPPPVSCGARSDAFGIAAIRSSTSFQIAWLIIRCWHSFWYVTRTHPRYSRTRAKALKSSYDTAHLRLPLKEGRVRMDSLLEALSAVWALALR